MSEEQKAVRKLRAILSADVKGYSLLMADDEAFTIKTLKEYRGIMSTQIKQHNGRVVDSPGDNVLADFASAVNAVACAVNIQKVLKEKNKDLPDDKKLEFRIGVNIGDVVQDGNRIYGSGVNVAARIEGLAEPGGVCISRNAYGQIQDKLDFGYEYLGEHSVKNIKQPVRVYKILMDPEDAGKLIGVKAKPLAKRWVWPLSTAVVILLGIVIWQFYQNITTPEFEPALAEKMAFPLPDKPSIAVLPFDNLSGNPEDEFVADGISESIITALSKTSSMFVIARNSTFTYKGKPTKVQRIAEDLGVQYVLEGSLQKSKDQLRINAQLIDAINGNHLWAEKYDRNMNDLFELQDDITMKIISALNVKLTHGEQTAVYAKGTDNLEAYLKVLQGVRQWQRYNKEGNAISQKIAKEVISLDPNYPVAYYLLSISQMRELLLGTTKSPQTSLKLSIENARKAISLDNSFAEAQALLGWLYTMTRQHEKGIAAAEYGLTLNHNSPSAYLWFGLTLNYAGKHEEAIEIYKKAIRISPIPSPNILFCLCVALRDCGRCEEGISAAKKAVQIEPDFLYAHTCLASCYALLDRDAEAMVESAEILRIDPKISLANLKKQLPYKDPAKTKFVVDSLRKAGLPDKPALPLPDKPSIAVLPFTNISGDPEQEYFSDGITEEIITALSKTPKLFVIARTSSFKYKGEKVDVRTVGRELGVRYVLEGSIRKSEDKVRITAQLIDAKTNNHLWAERYDRDLKDIFDIQDETTMKIITALRVKLTEGEQAAFKIKGTTNLDAYLKYLQAREFAADFNRNTNIKARRLAEEAIALDPNFQGGYSVLAQVELFDVWLRISKSPKESFMEAIKLAKKAIAIEDSPEPHRTLSGVYVYMRKFDEGIAEGKKAIELDPNSANAHGTLGNAYQLANMPQEAIPILEKAIRLSPYPPSRYFHNLAWSYNQLGEYEKAISAARKAVGIEQDDIFAHLALIYGYSLLKREEEVRNHVAEVLKINPKFCVRTYGKGRYKNPEISEHYRNIWRDAGLPGCPNS